MKAPKHSQAKAPVKALLTAAYGPGSMTAQLLAVFFTQYFTVTALDRKLRAQGKLSSRVGKLGRGYGHALSAYLIALFEETRKAVRTGDAQFFKDFANALEEPRRTSRGRDPAQCWLLMAKLKNATPKTVRQIREGLSKEARCNVDERQIYRLCRRLGIAVAKGREGRPRKTATNRQNQSRSSKDQKKYNGRYI